MSESSAAGPHASGFEIVRLLGEGGMGAVYLARDIALNRPVAIKVLSSALEADPEGRDRFAREAQVMATVDNRHVVRIYSFGETDDRPHIVMEYIDGQSLTRKISADRQLPIDTALRITGECIEALSAVWSKGVIHRDIKPANILLDESESIHVTDFGLAKPLDWEDEISYPDGSLLICTPHYAAPELVRGGTAIDFRADIYSLGVVLFEMLTGARPFTGDTPVAVVSRSLHEPVPDPRQLRPELDAGVAYLLAWMTHKDRSARPRSYAELAAAVRSLGAGAPFGPSAADEQDQVRLPSVFGDQDATRVARPTPFAGRGPELRRLDRALQQAIDGHGRALFITGEAGTGKSALLAEFARRAEQRHSGLAVLDASAAGGTERGEEYAPFGDLLRLLSGDVVGRLAAGSLERSRGVRLWRLIPHTAEALLDQGADLVGTLIAAGPLLERTREAAAPGTDWLERFEERFGDIQLAAPGRSRQQDLFDQFARIVEAVARSCPLLLLLDDLQWADRSSIELLALLGQRVAGQRALVLGAYRPSEVAIGRDQQRHPLAAVINEVERRHGEPAIALSQSGDRGFCDQLVDLEPNRLGEPFRRAVYGMTEGHPLFTLELLRNLQQSDMLRRDADGRWTEATELQVDALPARVEAVLRERVERLPDNLRRLLVAASVEGHDFTAEVIASVVGLETREVVRLLSEELEDEHRLVFARGVSWQGESRISRYRFSHVLFQRYVYDQIDEVSRSYLHEDVGKALAALHADEPGAIAHVLARHSQMAGAVDRAIEWFAVAGQRATSLYATEEAVHYFDEALALLDILPATEENAAMALQLILGRTMPIFAARGWTDDEAEQSLRRGLEISEVCGSSPDRCDALALLAVIGPLRGEHSGASALGGQAVAMAEQLSDRGRLAVAHGQLGWCLFFQGDLTGSKAHLDRALELGPGTGGGGGIVAETTDFRVYPHFWLGTTLRLLGYHDQAKAEFKSAGEIVSELDDPEALLGLLAHDTIARFEYGELEQMRDNLEKIERESARKGHIWYQPLALYFRGCLLSELGMHQAGVEHIERAIGFGKAIGAPRPMTFIARDFAAILGNAGEISQGLQVMEATIADSVACNDHCVEAELHRVRAELLTAAGAPAYEIEEELQRALRIARAQQAKAWELRAAMALGRLWSQQGRTEEARHLLGEIYDWFTEGLETRDLRRARRLLDTWTAADNTPSTV